MKYRSILICWGVAATLAVGTSARAQYAPYTPQQAYPVAGQYYQQVPAYQPTQQPPTYQPPVYRQPVNQNAPAGYGAAQPAHQGFSQGGLPQAGYSPAGQPRVAMQNELPTPAETIPLQGGPNMPGASRHDAPMQGAPMQQHIESTPSGHGYPATDNMQPATGWQSYTGAPCANGDCGSGSPPTDYGYGAACGQPDCGVSQYIQPVGRQWFVGLYSIGLARTDVSRAKLAVLVDSPAAYPYYPPAANTIVTTANFDTPLQWGAEIRFGSTFGCACNPCNPCGNQQPFAWEVAYWGLTENDEEAIVTDVWSDTDRMYGSMNFAGLEYDRDGAGATYAYRPVNDYYDYQMPIEDPTTDPNNVRVLGFRARNSFQAQNLELNILRFGLPGCGGCGGCGGCSPARFSFNGLMGFRYLNFDENFQFATMYTTVDGTGNPNAGEPTAYTSFPPGDDNNLFYDVDVDNHLYGFQLGSNMNYQIGCKWNIFCDSMFGIYGNQVDATQRVWSGGGGVVRFVNGGGNAYVDSNETDIAFLGEIRTGAAYQLTCNCRLTAAYRFIGVGGVAMAIDQIPSDFSNAQHVGYIDNNGSLILHGLQLGAEFKF